MAWPDSLIHEIAARRAIAFFGAGVSASSVDQDGNRPPDWAHLLINLKDSINQEGRGQVKANIEQLIAVKDYLSAAEILDDEITLPQKITILDRMLMRPRYAPSRMHTALLNLDFKTVITTNYDTIYDNYCMTGDGEYGYIVSKYYDNSIIANLKTPRRMILKAHGCITDVSKIVLTRKSYFDARKNHPNFYKILESLYTLNTSIFFGYSLNDPDIQMVLENSAMSSGNFESNYLVTTDDIDEVKRKIFKLAYNIEIIKFDTYDELYQAMEELVEQVASMRENYVS